MRIVENNPDRLPEDAGENPTPSGPAGGPEPPVRYNSQSEPVPPNGGNRPHSEFETVRRIVIAAQIMALVSLVIGGVVLSAAALATAAIGYRKTSAGAALSQPKEAAAWLDMKRSAIAAIVMGALAFALNVAGLIYIYPTVLDMFQSGDYTSFSNGADSTSAPNDSIWG